MNPADRNWWQSAGRINGVRLLLRLASRDALFDLDWYKFSANERAAIAVCAAAFVVTGGDISEQIIDGLIDVFGANRARVKAVIAWAKPSDEEVIALRRHLIRNTGE
jgi:hypothetical protein